MRKASAVICFLLCCCLLLGGGLLISYFPEKKLPTLGSRAAETVSKETEPASVDSRPLPVSSREAGPSLNTVEHRLERQPAWAIPYQKEFWRQTAKTDPVHFPVNLDEVVERTSHSFGFQGDKPEAAAGLSYRTSISEKGLAFAPLSSRIRGSAPALLLSTQTVRLGGSPIYDGAEPSGFFITGNTAQRLLSPSVVEHYETRSEGASVTWIIKEKPVTVEALEIELQPSGLPFFSSSADGHTFGRGRPEVRISHAKIVDADGAKFDVPLTRRGTHLIARIEPKILAGATYPVAVDPLISSAYELDERQRSRSPKNQHSPKVTALGSSWLVVWQDTRLSPEDDLVANIIDRQGNVQHPNGFFVTEAPTAQSDFQVVSSGSEYLVLWQELWSHQQGIRGFNGGSRSGFLISATGSGAKVARVGSLWCVSWTEGNLLRAVLLSGANKVTPVLDIAQGSRVGEHAIAGVGSRCLITWPDAQGVQARVLSTVSGEPQLSAPTTLATGNPSGLKAEGNGTDWLVTWNSGSSLLDGRVVSATRQIFTPGTGVLASSLSESHYEVSGGSGRWLVSYVSGASVKGAVVTRSDSTPISICTASGAKYEPRIGWNGTQWYVVWMDRRQGYEIYGTAVTQDGVAATPNGSPIATISESGNVQSPRIAGNNSGDYLVVWDDLEPDDQEVQAKAIRPDGTLSSLFTPSASTNGQFEPKMEWNPGRRQWLVTWTDLRTAGGRIVGQIVDSDGSPVFTNAFESDVGNVPYDLSADGNSWYMAAADTDGILSGHRFDGDFTRIFEKVGSLPLVDSIPNVGTLFTWQGTSAVQALFVDTSGRVEPEASPFDIALTATDPAICHLADRWFYSAGNGKGRFLWKNGASDLIEFAPSADNISMGFEPEGGYSEEDRILVAWEEGGTVKARFIGKYGALSGVSTVSLKGKFPQVARCDYRWLVVWNEQQDLHGKSPGIWGGFMETGPSFMISDQATAQSVPSLASNDLGWFVAWGPYSEAGSIGLGAFIPNEPELPSLMRVFPLQHSIPKVGSLGGSRFLVVESALIPSDLPVISRVTGTTFDFNTHDSEQTVEFAPIDNRTFSSEKVPLQATATSGLPVIFKVLSGPAIVNEDNTLTLTDSGPVTVEARQLGNADWQAAKATREFYVIPISAQITLINLEQPFDGEVKVADVVTFPPGLQTSISYPATPVRLPGSYRVSASITQPGYSGSTQADLVVTKLPQEITFLPPTDVVDETVQLVARSSRNLAVTFTVLQGPGHLESGNVLHLDGPGAVTVQATQEGTSVHLAAKPVTVIFELGKAGQTISNSYSPSAPIRVGGLLLDSTASSGLPVTFELLSGNATLEGNKLFVHGAGLVAWKVSQAGNDSYSPYSIEIAVQFTKVPQTVLPPTIFGTPAIGDRLILKSAATSGLPAVFNLVSGPAELTGNALTINGLAPLHLQVSVPGNAIFEPAPPVDFIVQARKRAQVITLQNPRSIEFTTEPIEITARASSGLPVQLRVTGAASLLPNSKLQLLDIGNVQVRASQSGDLTYSPAATIQTKFDVVDRTDPRLRIIGKPRVGASRTKVEALLEDNHRTEVLQWRMREKNGSFTQWRNVSAVSRPGKPRRTLITIPIRQSGKYKVEIVARDVSGNKSDVRSFTISKQ